MRVAAAMLGISRPRWKVSSSKKPAKKKKGVQKAYVELCK